MHKCTLLLAAVLAAGVGPVAAAAQDSAAPPSYARPSYAQNEDVIHGRIQSIDGKYRITVRDDKGYLDDVSLHQGTVINPTGLTLAPGMRVTIAGVNDGRTFDANQIDTPYVSYGPVYEPYPYPAYAYPYFGPAYSLGIWVGPRFGRGRWH